MISFALAASLVELDRSYAIAQEETIRTAWQRLKPTYRGSPFKTAPDLVNLTQPGEIDPKFAQDALNFIKFVRFVAGINSEIIAADDFNSKAQWGTQLLRLNQSLGHRVPKPESMTMDEYALASQGTAQSNISKFYGRRTDLVEMIYLQLIDDRENVWNVGHRRWLLNPYLQKVGLGFVQSGQTPTSYGAVMTTDQSGERDSAPDYVAWPSPNVFPLDLIASAMPWSVTLNPKKYRKPNVQQITITLTNLTSGKSWQFQPQDNNVQKTDSAFTANFCGKLYGFGPSFMFRPSRNFRYTDGAQFEVKILGLESIEGEPEIIAFQTKLIKLRSPVLLHASPSERDET
jgi:hypothetical protein